MDGGLSVSIAPDTRSAAEADIRSLFETGGAAWNRGDLDAYLAGYWDSEKTRWVTGGMVLTGKDAITAAAKARFPSPKEMGSFALLGLEFELVLEEDAVAFGEWAHTVGDVTRRGFFTARLRKFDGQWFVVSDHTSTAV